MLEMIEIFYKGELHEYCAHQILLRRATEGGDGRVEREAIPVRNRGGP
jgi:hypothetical protein